MYKAYLRSGFIFISLCAFMYFIIDKYMFLNKGLIDFYPGNASKYLNFKFKHYEELSIDEILSNVTSYNKKEKVLNIEKYGEPNENTTTIIINVGNNARSLKFVILSLTQVQGISEVLVIFSHSYYDENINDLVRSIDFCRVLQIFFPFSEQLNPNYFPGPEWLDMFSQKHYIKYCAENYLTERIRNAKLALTKHHWWWTANNVFDKINCLKGNVGLKIFLNDDTYIAKDFIYMLLFMKDVAKFFDTRIFSLEVKNFGEFDRNTNQVEIVSWDPTDGTRITAFDSNVWRSIVANYEIFCTTDNYLWPWSVFHTLRKHTNKEPIKVMSAKTPRAVILRVCWVFGIPFTCDSKRSMVDLVQKFNYVPLFPKYLQVHHSVELDYSYLKELDNVECLDQQCFRGKWSDPRDWELCSNNTIIK